jgi:hypothetical protein
MIKRDKAEQSAARSERLSAALRENLKRRKEQARGRTAAPAAEDSSAGDARIKPADPDFRRNPGWKLGGSGGPGSGRGG